MVKKVRRLAVREITARAIRHAMGLRFSLPAVIAVYDTVNGKPAHVFFFACSGAIIIRPSRIFPSRILLIENAPDTIARSHFANKGDNDNDNS